MLEKKFCRCSRGKGSSQRHTAARIEPVGLHTLAEISSFFDACSRWQISGSSQSQQKYAYVASTRELASCRHPLLQLPLALTKCVLMRQDQLERQAETLSVGSCTFKTQLYVSHCWADLRSFASFVFQPVQARWKVVEDRISMQRKIPSTLAGSWEVIYVKKALVKRLFSITVQLLSFATSHTRPGQSLLELWEEAQ